MINRRGFIAGLVAAPAIIRTINLMPVKSIRTKTLYLKPEICLKEFNTIDGIIIEQGVKVLLVNPSKPQNSGIYIISNSKEYLNAGNNLNARESSFKDYSQKLDAELRRELERKQRISQNISGSIL